jgi:hypothetical protein
MNISSTHVTNFLDQKTLMDMYHTIVSAEPNLKVDPTCSPSKVFFALFNDVHETIILPQCINVFKKNLVPTFNCGRIYYAGSELKPHIDRHACEYSVTLNISNLGVDVWPLFFKNSDTVIQYDLQPGDAVFYPGRHLPHWREPLSGGKVYQVFFHFVDKNGTLSKLAYEGWQ